MNIDTTNASILTAILWMCLFSAGQSVPVLQNPGTGTNQVIVQQSATNLSINRFESIKFADQFAGASTSAQVLAACLDVGTRGTVIIPSSMAAGAVTGAPDGCNIWDLRGIGDTFSGGTTGFNGLEISQRYTATQTLFTFEEPLGINADYFRGGLNNYPNKTQQSALRIGGNWRTVGEHHSVIGYNNAQASGDMVGAQQFNDCFGGYGTGGDEGCEAFRGWANWGDNANNDVPTGVLTTVSGANLTGSWTLNAYLGERSEIINTTAHGSYPYSTGTVQSAGSTTPCVITFAGTTLTSLTVGAHTDLFLRLKQFETSAAEWFVVPLTDIVDNTHAQVEDTQHEVGASCFNLTFTNTSFIIYQGSKVAQGSGLSTPDGNGNPQTVTLTQNATMFNTGDNVQQPLSYNVALKSFTGTVYSPFTAPNNSSGIVIASLGPGSVDAGSRFIASSTGGFNFGETFEATGGGRFGTLVWTNGADAFLDNEDLSSSIFNMWTLLNTGGSLRVTSYDRPNDDLNIQGTTISIHGSNSNVVFGNNAHNYAGNNSFGQYLFYGSQSTQPLLEIYNGQATTQCQFYEGGTNPFIQTFCLFQDGHIQLGDTLTGESGASGVVSIGNGSSGDASGTLRTKIYQIGGTDTGISRASAGSIDVGNGTQGNATGTINAAGYLVGGTSIVVFKGTKSIGGSIVAAQTCSDTSATITGAATTMTAAATPAGTLAGNWTNFQWSAYVSASNTVRVHICNVTATALTPTAMNFNLRVIP